MKAEAKKSEEDRAAAADVSARIAAIGEVTEDSKDAIAAARAAFDALTETQKSLVNNVETLLAAEDAYAALSAEISFADIEKHWARDAIISIYRLGLVNGVGENRFAPDMEITRGMVVTILYRLEGEPAVSESCAFNDVAADRYYRDAVIWANDNGVVYGMNETVFAPEANITREQLATMICRYAKYKGADVTGTSDLAGYTDAAAVSGWAKEAMGWANHTGLIRGRSQTELVPRGTATRAEFTMILTRYLQKFAG